ncbi:MAG: tRNA ((37)-N6)-dimethylallyltransferase MiaA, partial [Pseudomonadota bacterium]
RAELDAAALARGWPALHQELAQLDPETAARLHPTDSQRIQRALEICRLSGRPMSALLAEAESARPPWRFLKLGLQPAARSVLHALIARRFQQMLADGLEDEVSRLRRDFPLHLGLPSMRCVGYRQVWEAQDGLIPHAELCDRGIFATRQLAKRQLTWMNNTLQPEMFDSLDPQHLDALSRRVSAFLGSAG